MKIVIPAERPKYEMSLPDGATLTLSPVLKTDREFFERGIDELSLESRFARFGQGVSSLTQRELDYLSDVDQRHHVAWGAAIGDDVAGVGRYIVPTEDACAELAITVLDAMQHRGVGSCLLRALVAVARADGIHELCFETQAANEAVLRLIREVEPVPLVTDGLIRSRIRIGEIPTGADEPGLVEVIDEVRG
ncbi:MAG TPA: GNAT family N-acetyltransferase [Acidimicrobiia bacterium]|jgi:GNAT superfamily N-acetyltransferase|nr:GNAT family N-acetyltransferase [Acidimicrobiia bacterium]